MTLNQLKRLDPKAYEAWMKRLDLTPEQRSITTRAYKVNGRLFIVWNNGCFYEAFRYDGRDWSSLAFDGSRAWRSKYYARACKTLGRLDRLGIYG